jgi:hypothetical protein
MTGDAVLSAVELRTEREVGEQQTALSAFGESAVAS